MSYENYAGVPKAIDEEIAALPNVKNPASVRGAVTGLLRRRVDGTFDEKITRAEIRAALTRLQEKSPHLFVQPVYDKDEEILRRPFESLSTENERIEWKFCAERRFRRQRAS